MSRPLVSVVTPFYNTAPYLRECIESVLRQTYADFEYILVDNRSDDGSTDIAASYAQRDSRVRLIPNAEFLDQVGNYNEAVRHISSESAFVKVVQADDWLFPECLSAMTEVARRAPSIVMVGAYTILGWARRATVYLDGLPYPSEFVPGREVCRRFLLEGLSPFGSPTATLIRADIVRARRDLYFRPAYPVEDLDLCLDILQDGDFGFVHQVLTYTRRHNDSTISRLSKANIWQLTELYALRRYGPRYLSDAEYRDRRSELERSYYLMLGESALRRRPAAFWEVHRSLLKDTDEPLSLSKVILHALLCASLLALNPVDTARRLVALARQRPKWRSN